ncbi:MAG: hypothetical protein QNJ55_26960 [Xenococcus sp. MO_188.B8]|nr:hypothetical protein [Xenococcus sp. MO_188.B8]
MMIPTQIGKKLTLLQEIKYEAFKALSNCLDDAELRLYYQSYIINNLYELFSDWLSYEENLGEDCLTSSRILEIRQSARAHPALELFKYANFVQAGRIGKRDTPDKFLLEPEVESNPGSPSVMHVLYNRKPKARGSHTPLTQAIIEMYDKATLDFIEVDAAIQRMKRTAKIICDSVLQKSYFKGPDSNFFILDIACGGNHLAREIQLILDPIKKSDNLLCNVHILGVDLDSRAENFTFKDIDRADSLGWYSSDKESSIKFSFLKGNLMLKKTQKIINEWIQAYGVDKFDVVTALGIIDYFGCSIPGSSKEYIPEKYASSFGELMLSLAETGGLLIGAVYNIKERDSISTGARHLLANWQINPVSKICLINRFKFLDNSDFYDVATPDILDDISLREKLNRVLHFFVHQLE